MVNLKLNQPALLYHVNKYCFILELCSQYYIHCHEGTTPNTLVSVFRKGCKPMNTFFFVMYIESILVVEVFCKPTC